MTLTRELLTARPLSADEPICHYISFRFLSSLVDRGALYANQFSNLHGTDGMEGRLSLSDQEFRRQACAEDLRAFGESEARIQEIIALPLEGLTNASETYQYMVCFRRDDVECPRAWEEYGRDRVMLRTTVDKMGRALKRFVRFDAVDYFDREIHTVHGMRTSHLFTKQPKFDWEQEARIVVTEFPLMVYPDGTHFDLTSEMLAASTLDAQARLYQHVVTSGAKFAHDPVQGVLLPVDLHDLVDLIVTGPGLSSTEVAQVHALADRAGWPHIPILPATAK